VEEQPMTSKGLLVRLEAKPGKDAEVEEFLVSALDLLSQEPDTAAWFGVRFGRSEYGIVDAFPDDAARRFHLAGPVARALGAREEELFASEPEIVDLDVLADKLPSGDARGAAPVTKGLLLTFEPKSGHEDDVAGFLRAARSFVDDEDGTIAWFAIRLDGGRYGIFDVFPDNRARFAHLVGHVPRELAKSATSLLGGFPDMDMLDVVAAKLPDG
jgi:quinol monooxygenase YgiN